MTNPELFTRLYEQMPAERAAELAHVVTALDEQVHHAAPDAVIGTYLVGSFGLGAGDEHADVDFLVVLSRALDAEEELRIREVHRGFPDRPEYWAHYLEGSYAPVDSLSARPDGTAWLYVDNGNREMEFTPHDNTEVTRWILHHHGLAISGPPATTLLDAPPPQVVREAAGREAVRRRGAALADTGYLASAWGQPHEVLTQCRLLYTATTGKVAGKLDAARWCLDVVDTSWRPLLEAAIVSRPDPWKRIPLPADPALTAQMPAFLECMAALSTDAADVPRA